MHITVIFHELVYFTNASDHEISYKLIKLILGTCLELWNLIKHSADIENRQ